MPKPFVGWRGRWRRTERKLLLAGACSVCSTAEQWAWMIVVLAAMLGIGLPGGFWFWLALQRRRHAGA
ncbi:hypothetical protein ACVXHB_08170 [Escherichia coli]